MIELLIEKYIPPTEINIFGTKLWYNKRREFHSINDQPSVICYEKNEITYKCWNKNGFIHRDKNKPAMIYYRYGKARIKYWYKNDKCIKTKHY